MTSGHLCRLFFLLCFFAAQLGVDFVSDGFVLGGTFADTACLHLEFFHGNQILSGVITMLKVTLLLQRLVQKTTSKKDGASING